MENEITAHRGGTVSELSVATGEPVKTGQVICVVIQEGEEAEPDQPL
jgi:biotin carboxyl carrier protein